MRREKSGSKSEYYLSEYQLIRVSVNQNITYQNRTLQE